MNLKEKVTKQTPVYNGEIINVEKQQVKLPDGQLALREVVKHQQAVAILALTNDHKIILERQWRTPTQRALLEIPAGKIDNRDKNPLAAVYRELNEELRVKPKLVKQLMSFYTSPGFTDEYMYLYLAKDLQDVKQVLPRDQGENLEILTYTLPEVKELWAAGKIQDAKTIIAIQYWELHNLNKIDIHK